VGRDGRGNHSHVPRCIDCGHAVDQHTKNPAGCRGYLDPCPCKGYADEPRRALADQSTEEQE